MTMIDQSAEIAIIVEALRKVPAKSLRLIELANQVPIHFGIFDPDALAALQPEIDLALTEAWALAEQTHNATVALIKHRQ